MKKYLALFTAMLGMATAWAQNWNESTRDAAYEAPNSRLTSATWEGSPGIRPVME